MSLAFVRLIAARHTCMVQANEGADMGSIDATLQSSAQPRRLFNIQLKATSSPLDVVGGEACFDLPINNYNDLRATDVTVPQLLVVMQLPRDEAQWLVVNPAEAIVRERAWWTDLWGAPSVDNASTIRVKFPSDRTFSNDALTRIFAAMARIAAGEPRKPLYEY